MANNIIGKGIKKTKEATEKIQKITSKIDNVNKYAILASDGLQAIRSIINNNVDDSLYEIKEDLKKQAKSYAIQRVREELPTEQEIIDKILEKSCDIQIMNIVKETKINLESVLNKSKNTLKVSIDKLEKLKKKTDKSLESLTNISLLLVIFQSLVTALEILIEAAKISLLVFTGIFANGTAIATISKKINEAEALVLKYTGAIKTYSNYALRVVNIIISIFNFIPIIIDLFEQLKALVERFLVLLKQYYEKYIIKCVPGGISTDPNGNLNQPEIDKFFEVNTPDLNNLKSDILGDYIRDSKEQRIYRPKIN